MPDSLAKASATFCSALTCDCLNVHIVRVLLSPPDLSSPPQAAALAPRARVIRTARAGRHARRWGVIAGPSRLGRHRHAPLVAENVNRIDVLCQRVDKLR